MELYYEQAMVYYACGGCRDYPEAEAEGKDAE